MSIQALAWVLQNSKAELTDRLVLIAIANHCDAHWCCYPSIDMIAAEARVSRSSVLRSIKELVRLAELEVSPGGRGKGQRSTYRLAHYQGCQDDTVKLDFTVSSATSKGVTGDTHKPLRNRTTRVRAAVEPPAWEPEGALQKLTQDEKARSQERLRALRERATG